MNKKIRYIVLIVVITLTIGFGAISSNMFLDGTVSVGVNEDAKMYISYANIDGSNKDVDLSYDRKSFKIKLEEVKTYTVSYRMVNKSKASDALVNIECVSNKEVASTISNSFNSIRLQGNSHELGELTITKNATGEEEITCVMVNHIEATIGLGSNVDEGTIYGEIEKNSLGSDEENEINYSSISSNSNGLGIYTIKGTESNRYPVKYYRGEVENNNIIFGGYCWLIVRTTEGGGVKLIYNGEVDEDGECTSTGANTTIGKGYYNYPGYNDNTYVGYMYGITNGVSFEETHENIHESTIKGTIDNWYQDNLIEYTKMLEDTIWCNDRSVEEGTGISINRTTYKGAKRAGINEDTSSPSLACERVNDRFTVSTENGNGKLEYPVGLLTVDEVIYAGGIGYKEGKNSNSDYYLKGSYWTMTPGIYEQSEEYQGYNIYVSEEGIKAGTPNQVYIRPSISLKRGTRLYGGDGSKENPYIVEPTNEIGDEFLFNYNGTTGSDGSEQTLTVPMNGTYKIELWGAQGGNSNTSNNGLGLVVEGGNGSYVSGNLLLNKYEKLYIYVGGKGLDGGIKSKVVPSGGYNGGGNGVSEWASENEINGGAGGGATDIRLTAGTWSNFESLKSRIMVAAGGAGRSSFITHGDVVPGGSLTGFDGTISTEANFTLATGGTQTSGGLAGGGPTGQTSPHSNGVGSNGGFGFGGDSNYDHGSGAGSGYYGGGGGGWISNYVSSAGSGSSFISGYLGCNAISVLSEEDNIIHSDEPEHYSRKKFDNAIMLDGNQNMPGHDGKTFMKGNSGHGYAKITLISYD